MEEKKLIPGETYYCRLSDELVFILAKCDRKIVPKVGDGEIIEDIEDDRSVSPSESAPGPTYIGKFFNSKVGRYELDFFTYDQMNHDL